MAYAFVAATSAVGSGGGSTTTGAIDTTGASFFVVVTSSFLAAATVSDNNSNSWFNVTTQAVGSFGYEQISYAYNATGGAGHTFTSGGSSAYSPILVIAFSGSPTTDPLDGSNGSTNGSTATIQPGSLTPSQNDALLITGVGADGVEGGWSINGGFTIARQVTYGSGASYAGAIAYLIQTSAAAANPTWTSANPVPQGTTIASFISTGGGGGGDQPMMRRWGGFQPVQGVGQSSGGGKGWG